MIVKATMDHLHQVTDLALKLWPENEPSELEEEMARLLQDRASALFLNFQDGRAVGFAQCQLRSDYVEGTGSSPVGYLEGIYVEDDCRLSGIAKALLAACESWAKDMGCREFASDCELHNMESLRFHLAVGFLEANRIICFTKNLK